MGEVTISGVQLVQVTMSNGCGYSDFNTQSCHLLSLPGGAFDSLAR